MAAILAAVAVTMIATPTAFAHGPGQNGCTLVPDSGRTFNFHTACDRHDRCYDQLWYGKGTWHLGIGWTGRLACDDLWLREMKDSCRIRYPNRFDWRRMSCNDIADGYYIGVRVGGAAWFDNPNLN